MSSAQTRIQGFDWLRCIAIVAVIGIHSSDLALRKNGYFATASAEGSFYFAFQACLRFCVPVFLLMSAFLAESRRLKTGENPGTRWKRYAFPCLAAGIFYTLLSLLEARLQHKPISGRDLLLQALSGQAYYHLWYVYAALIFVLLHPWLRRLASGVPFALLGVGTTALYAATNGWILPLYQAGPIGGMVQTLIMAFPYYVAGIWFAGHSEAMRVLPRQYVFAGLFAGIALVIFYGVGAHVLTFYTPAAELLSLAAFALALQMQKPPPAWVVQIGAYSLGIYLWHPLFLEAVRLPQGRYYREAVSPAITLGLMLLEIGVGLAGGFLTAKLLSRVPALRGLAQ